MKPLLAKSYDKSEYPDSPPQYALLTQHSRDVADACNSLVNTIGLQCLRNAGLPEEIFSDLSRAVILNGWIQDAGKANSHFQNMLTRLGHTQLIRHEILSAILFWTRPELTSWLSELPESIRLAAIWGALGHHRKFDKYYVPNEMTQDMIVYLSHPDFETILSELAQSLALSGPPKFTNDLTLGMHPGNSTTLIAKSIIYKLQEDFTDLSSQFKTQEQKRFLALVKSIGIAADVCASAICFEQSRQLVPISIDEVIVQQLGKTGLAEVDFIGIIERRLSKATQTSTSDPRLDFQHRVARSSASLTLVEAGCGSGKSIAAYKWGANYCHAATEEGRKNFRFFFCLPTTGTTTEHFKDYALECGIAPSLLSLTHSKAVVDLQTLAETVNEENIETGETNSRQSIAESCLRARKDKIESLALWSTPLVVTTADTVLGLMVNARRSIYSLPAIMSAAIVFDECHAFDDQMFKLLLAFIKNFPNIPTLLMTASLPRERRKALVEARPDMKIVQGPKEFEEKPRYLFSANSNDILSRVKACVDEGGKVLWVRNRVQWANEQYRDLTQEFPYLSSIDIYHSRLKYKHRSIRHSNVIETFKKDSKACILIATQVAEMSLDLSADLLITDNAPIPALMQRMGRLNRKANPKEVVKPNVFVMEVPEDKVAPYSVDELKYAEQWFQNLCSLKRPLNQRDLAENFETVGKSHTYNIAKAEKEALYFSGLWQTRTGLTRNTGYTMNVILQNDLENCTAINQFGNPDADWIRNHEVAIPIREEMTKWQKVGHIPVAPTSRVTYDYNEKTNIGTGAEWK